MPASVPPPPELPDLYTPSAQLLSLLSLGNRALLSRREDPLPLALTKLTGYDMDAVSRMGNVTDNASLYAVLGEAPELFANHLLLGRLAYASPLGPSLATMLAAQGSAPPAELARRRAEVLAFVAHHTSWFGDLIENYLLTRYEAEDQAEVAQERAELRSGAEAVFAEWGHSLGALLLPAPAPVLPMLAERGWSLHPMQIQLDTLVLALSTLGSLPHLSHHPFADAVAHLPDYHPQRLEELADYVGAAEAGARLPLTREQGLLLFLAANVVMVLFVSDVLDGEGLDDLLLRRHQQTPGDEEITPETISRLREAVAIMLPGYMADVRGSEAEAADFQALEARLAPVLALAVA